MDAKAVLEKYQYEPSTGNFQHMSTKPNRGVLKTAKGYVRVFVGKKYYMAHHLVWLLHTGRLPNKQIDHINGNAMTTGFQTYAKSALSKTARTKGKHTRQAQPGCLG